MKASNRLSRYAYRQVGDDIAQTGSTRELRQGHGNEL